jgi:uridine kinase
MNLIAALSDLCSKSARPIITIDGPAGAGKTTLARDLFLALSINQSVRVIHMDDLYDGWENGLSESLTSTLSYIVTSHRAGASYDISRFNWEKSEFEAPQNWNSTDLLILEGVGSGQSAIRKYVDASIWIGIDPLKGLERVINRDGEKVAHEMRRWLISQDAHFTRESTLEESDFVLTS